MKKNFKIFVLVSLFAALGFGITPEANSETTMYQELPCWKRKGNPLPGAGFLYCPKFIITLSCDYIDDYLPNQDYPNECNYNPV